MTHLQITVTKLKRLAAPQPMPEADANAAKTWFNGFWYGTAIGVFIGGATAVLLLESIGKLAS